jgi:hypothetical protein
VQGFTPVRRMISDVPTAGPALEFGLTVAIPRQSGDRAAFNRLWGMWMWWGGGSHWERAEGPQTTSVLAAGEGGRRKAVEESPRSIRPRAGSTTNSECSRSEKGRDVGEGPRTPEDFPRWRRCGISAVT